MILVEKNLPALVFIFELDILTLTFVDVWGDVKENDFKHIVT